MRDFQLRLVIFHYDLIGMKSSCVDYQYKKYQLKSVLNQK